MSFRTNLGNIYLHSIVVLASLLIHASVFAQCQLTFGKHEKIKELNTDDLTAKLQIESEEIAETLGLLNPLSPYRQDTGANNLGVFEVSTYFTGSSVALKITPAEYFDYSIEEYSNRFRPDKISSGSQMGSSAYMFHQYLLVHHLLGEINVAPKLIAVLKHSELVKLYDDPENGFANFADSNGRYSDYRSELKTKPGNIGILMEMVDRDWQLSRKRGFSEMFKEWSLDDLVRAFEKIDYIHYVLKHFRIFASDMQLVATPKKDILLLDLDGFRFYTKDEDVLPYSFYTEYNRLITAWETINNTKVPEHIRQIWDPKFPSHDGIYTSTMPDSRSKRP